MGENPEVVTKCKAVISSMKTSDTCGMVTELVMAENFPYMVCNNVDKDDGLINGAVGILMRIDTNNSGQPVVAWIKFADESIGRQLRGKIRKKYPTEVNAKWTPITKVVKTFCLRLRGGNKSLISVDRLQFPITPAAALTIHKLQGKTVDAIELDLRSGRPVAALHYVALSRCRTEAGNRLVYELDPTQIKVSEKVRTEMNRMRETCLFRRYLRFPFEMRDESTLSVVFHNVQSLRKHYRFTQWLLSYRGADVLIFCETWLKKPKDRDVDYEIPGYQLHRFDWPYRGAGYPHAGMVVYILHGVAAVVSEKKIGSSAQMVLIDCPEM